MKNMKLKIIITAFFAVLMITVCAIPCFAQFDMAGHYDPNGTTSTYYAYPSGECNRTINVSMYDLNGNFLKKVVIKTKYGEDNSFHIGLGGYDIVNFSSNQSILETCQLVWTSGTGLCEEADLFVNYYFRTALSLKELNIRVEMRKWDPIKISVKHYVESNPKLNNWHRSNYYLHSTDQQMTKNYYDYFSTSKKTITGYTLNTEYKSSVSGYFCYDSLMGSCKNCPTSPRCHSYDLHQTDWSDDMGHWSTYKESKHGRIDWCDNREFWVEYFYDINEYTVSYNANGGSGAPASQTKYYGMDLALSETVPTRSGYTFKGWGTSSTSTSPSYQPGGNYTSNSSRTLYAIWESNAPKTYTVSYNANGGSGAPASQTKTHNVTLTLRTTVPTRSGYTFKGWSTSSTATTASYSAGGSYTTNASATMYAVWQKNPAATYTVSYNANGGSGAPASQTKTHNVTLTLRTTVPTRSGYTFKGWSTSSTATTATYSAGGSYTANASATLYAVWEAVPPTLYTISFNANGGSGAPGSVTKTHGVTLTLPSTIPYRSNYTFLGWSTSSTASSPSYYAGGSFTTNANTTLYAVWEYDPATYTVSYNANGGTGAPGAQTKTYGVTLTLSSTKPTRSGYTFQGWSTSSAATSPSYSAGGSFTTNANTTLYAVWKANPPATYTVSYNANGGSGAPASQTKTQNVTLTLSSTTPTRTGYNFLGWSTSSTATSPTYYAGGSYTANSAVTLYAVWSKIPPEVYTISFSANGGSGAPSAVSKTESVTMYLPTTVPTRQNYDFLGWSLSSTATTATYSAGGSFTRNANTTLYAVWSYNPETYTVSYNANGGSGAPSSQTKTYGVNLTLSSTVPTRGGYNFLGWSTSSTATSATYSAGGSYTANAGATLYAVWEKANYEFSISNLTVSDSEPYRYGTITVKVRTDSWDQKNPYSDIPVQLYYDGRLMSTQYVDFAAYGVANLTFTLYVGDTPGYRSIEARINWSNRGSETNTGNNSVATSINVRDFDYEMSVDDVTMSGNYCAGETVISSFTVSNDSDYDITPDMGNSASFTAYYFNGSQKVVIATDTWNNVVIPSGKTNLVYFKWTVPSNLVGKMVYCECTINSTGSLNEENRGNNTSTFSTTITSFADSQTPNTRYESSKPGSYKGYSAPANSTDKATWTMWVYENNQFVLKSYGVQISTASPVIAPSAECKTAVYANGKWTIRSGYGFTMSYSPTITTVSGYNNPGSSAYTSIQSVYATFPEFNYATTNGNYRNLQYVDGKWQFVQNTNAADNERIHFIPVWFTDGNYTVSVTATRVWTPVGMIEATRTANAFTIDGSIYDDYFVGN